MQALVITKFDDNFKYIEVQDCPIPKPENGEVLIRIEVSSLSPADSLLIRNAYIKSLSLPAIPGLFGIGSIVESGGGIMGKFLKGKRVLFEAKLEKGGAWAEYAIADANICFPIGDIVPQDGLSIGNTITAMGMLDVSKKIGAKSIVMSAAAGSLGRFVNMYFPQKNMNVISIIRSQKQREILESIGAKYILNQKDEDFEDKLSQLTTELKSTVAFDSVGGSLPRKLMRTLPKHSTIFSIGNLSGRDVEIDPTKDMMRKMQKYQTFVVPEWLDKQSFPRKMLTLSKARKIASSLGEKNSIRKTVTLQQTAQEMSDLFTDTSAGVVLVCPAK
ncbi:alcohol dehydrogenase catalytic domain-containing protein [Candidatus Uabimicrobium sp. HlEnr_7]|uniref:alcohol dehydrogenase catalytic domain-containing protein n=1 Tax=Candidatus Uabimicrobium helgolandensis TaxID=3095367 RepID=UPI0035582D96